MMMGSPGEMLHEHLEKRPADLVVMTSHGRSGVRRAALGSVTDRLLHGPAPVLVIRDHGESQGGLVVKRAIRLAEIAGQALTEDAVDLCYSFRRNHSRAAPPASQRPTPTRNSHRRLLRCHSQTRHWFARTADRSSHLARTTRSSTRRAASATPSAVVPAALSAATAARAMGGGGGGGGFSRAPRMEREMFDVVCSSCGQQTKVPFQPRGDRPVYCRDCFERVGRPSGGGGGRSMYN